MSLQLQLERAWYSPGDLVRGRVIAQYAVELRSLVVNLDYMEHTEDYDSVGRQISTGPLAAGQLEAGRALDFTLTVPEDALPSLRGRHGELYWRVDAKGDRFGQDAHAEQRIVLVPKGHGPPAGWYADPSGEHRVRWWDGTGWTQHVA